MLARILVGVGLVVLCVAETVAAQPVSEGRGDATTGARLFRARGCLDCHAKDVMDLQRPPRSPYALAASMWNHLPLMAERIRVSGRATPYVTSGEMRDVAAFLASDDLALLDRPGDPKRGEHVVVDSGCLTCHSISTPRGSRAGSLGDLKGLETPWAVMAQLWNHAFLMELETQGQRFVWPRLTAADTADLVAFLQTLMRAR